jgi:NAD(P)H-flavin reductase
VHRRSARVAANDPLTPSVRRLVLAVEDGPFAYAPGQAVIVEVRGDGDAPIRAPYSIASAPGERGPGTIELAVAKDLPESRSRTMHDLAVGAPVEVVGPVGTFARSGEAEAAPALFVAAGTGLSPLRAMLADELARRPSDGPPLVLLFGARSEDEVLWQDDLAAWAARSPRLTTLVTLSRPSGAWIGRRGWVQAHLADAARLAGPHAYAFVCGPEAMVTEVMSALGERHLPHIRVLRERYS